VADNGSTDGSVEIAKRSGARVEHVAEKSYGNALMAGIESAKGMSWLEKWTEKRLLVGF
jgi:glycosyltransferase involved in cell wall biosynthesis